MLRKVVLSVSNTNKMKEIITDAEQSMDDDTESIITNERYEYIEKLVKNCLKKKNTGMTVSDKIDRVITNRFLALPVLWLLCLWSIIYP